MAGQLNRPDFSLTAPGAYFQACGDKALLKLGVHSIITEILFGMIFTTADAMEERAGGDLDRLVSGSFGTAFAPVGQRTGERRDHVVRAGRILLSSICIGDLQDVARIL